MTTNEQNQAAEPDHVIARRELDSLFATLGISAEVGAPRYSTEPMGEPKTAKPWPHFAYTITFSKGGRSMVVEWSCGADDKERERHAPNRDRRPQLPEVLASVCQESLEAHEQSFDDWASTFGYDTDSRHAESIYRLCCERYHQAKGLVSGEQMVALSDLASRL